MSIKMYRTGSKVLTSATTQIALTNGGFSEGKAYVEIWSYWPSTIVGNDRYIWSDLNNGMICGILNDGDVKYEFEIDNYRDSNPYTFQLKDSSGAVSDPGEDVLLFWKLTSF